MLGGAVAAKPHNHTYLTNPGEWDIFILIVPVPDDYQATPSNF
jgi:hypothetical protein